MNCQFCGERCIKKGSRNCRQIYRCLSCSRYQRAEYKSNNYSRLEQKVVAKLTKEGLSIRSIARFLEIPKSSVGRLLLQAGNEVETPTYNEKNEEYEIDELKVVVGGQQHEVWICYAINRRTKQVIDFVVGRKTKTNIRKVIKQLLPLKPKKIYSDKLPLYRSLIPKDIHSTKFKATNHIERKNLTLRTHLKRLNRKTICFSRSIVMLTACLKLYFWK